jgi:hypothetical protein
MPASPLVGVGRSVRAFRRLRAVNGLPFPYLIMEELPTIVEFTALRHRPALRQGLVLGYSAYHVNRIRSAAKQLSAALSKAHQ